MLYQFLFFNHFFFSAYFSFCFSFFSVMSTPTPQQKFGNFIAFLVYYQQSLSQDPYRGKLDAIKWAFAYFCQRRGIVEEFEDLAAFDNFLQQFNEISGNALVFSNGSYGDFRILSYIKITNVHLLRERLDNLGELLIGEISDAGPLKADKAPLKRLQTFLEKPLGTVVPAANPKEKGFSFDLDRLSSLISEPTAATRLGISRAQLLTAKKPFMDICESGNHSQMLANLCLGSKNIGNSIHDLPSNAKIHKVISSCKSLMDKQIQNCVKSKVHFLPLVTGVTDLYLGNCSYLDTCHKLKSCRYLHYYTLNPPPSATKSKDSESKPVLALDYTVGECHDTIRRQETPAQWISCDVRHLPFSILGKFSAIISDPAWDIHMSLPYGTCKDAELLSLPMNQLQDEGILMLWVTGRSIEIGRRALAQWGYSVSDEMIWIKLNQLRRTIVTGRTGHWLNHSKEHLLVGIKGDPRWLNRKIDLDFIVSGTRETLRKPDELYGVVERLVGRHSRKLEIFGRDHNIRPGWFSTYHSFIYLFRSPFIHSFRRY